MCASKHAPRDPFRRLERRHGLAEIVERGGGVLVILREHCASVGEVASVELLMRGYNGTVPTGSAIVQFYSASAASSAIKDLNGTELDGRRLYVRAYFT